MATKFPDPNSAEEDNDFTTGDEVRELFYPYENTARYGGEITFDIHRVVPPNINLEEVPFDKLVDNLKSTAIGQSITGVKETKEQKQVRQDDPVNLSNVVSTAITIPTGRSIYMYMPTAFSVNDGLVYDTPGIGIRGGILADELAGNSGAVKAVADATLSGLRSIGELFSGNLTGDLARLGLSRAAQSAKLDDRVQKAVGLAGRVSINPNIRAAFSNVAIREFTFQFKFIPTSPREAKEVEDIIACFRQNAYPEDIAINEFETAGFNYPNLFNIRLGYYDPKTADTIQVGTKIKKCYLRGIQTNYNPSAMAFHADGKPVEYDLSLSFVEHKTISRKDVKEGY